MKVDLTLYVLADPAQSGGRPLGEISLAAAHGGATLIQLRNKTGTTRELVEQARAIRIALAGSGVPLLIDDRVDVAFAAEADGVHLGRDDLDARVARRLLGPQAIIGATVRGDRDVATLAPGVIDYVCIGGVFATSSKDNPDPPIGLHGLSRLARLTRLTRKRVPGIPVGAIAGINEGNAAEVIGAGADGIAVVSAVTAAPDPERAARELRCIVDAAKAKPGRAA